MCMIIIYIEVENGKSAWKLHRKNMMKKIEEKNIIKEYRLAFTIQYYLLNVLFPNVFVLF